MISGQATGSSLPDSILGSLWLNLDGPWFEFGLNLYWRLVRAWRGNAATGFNILKGRQPYSSATSLESLNYARAVIDFEAVLKSPNVHMFPNQFPCSTGCCGVEREQ